MIVFYTEEDYQKEIEEAEGAARRELALVMLKQLEELRDRVDAFYGREEAVGVAMVIGTIARVAKLNEVKENGN